jgi:hypothetical protein
VILLQWEIETAEIIENMRSPIIQSGKPADPDTLIEDRFLDCSRCAMRCARRLLTLPRELAFFSVTMAMSI